VPRNHQLLFTTPGMVYFAAIGLGLIGMALGYGLSRLLRQDARRSRTIALETGIQNGPLAVLIVLLTFRDALQQEVLLIPVLYSLFIVLTSSAITVWFRRITTREELARGPAVLTMSGDKLLGSVQAGIILGREEELGRIRRSPMMRAVRVDKLTIALLEATLFQYLDPERVFERVPVLRLISRPPHAIRQDAERLREKVLARLPAGANAEIVEGESEAGGGAIGQPPIPTFLLALSFGGIAPDEMAAGLRAFDPPVIVRVKSDRVVVDPRTLFPEEIDLVADAIVRVAVFLRERASAGEKE
jgi:hypothetical protein